MLNASPIQSHKLVFVIILSLLLLAILGCDEDDPGKDSVEGALVINELCAKNAETNQDDAGDYDDWIELFNASDADIDIGGYWLSDDSTNPFKWMVPDDVPLITTIQAGEYLLLWADDEIDEGILHMSFSLKGTGECVSLVDEDGDEIDKVIFGPQNDDISFGRLPNGSNQWSYLDPPTPNAPNANQAMNRPPLIGDVEQTPEFILPNEKVYLRTDITDETTITTAKIFYRIDDGEFQESEMHIEYGYTFVGEIPGQSDGSLVEYYISATDSEGMTASSPAYAPANVYSYEVLQFSENRRLFINELQAVNNVTITDDNGEYEDWIEIYNAGAIPFDIGGLYITDDLNDPYAHQIPTTNPEITTIPPRGFIVLWADDDLEQGELHLPFKLSWSGESIGLLSSSGDQSELLDGVNYPEILEDESYGRTSDGGSQWSIISVPTPGTSN